MTTSSQFPHDPVERWSDDELEKELTLAALTSTRGRRFERLLDERRRRRGANRARRGAGRSR